MGLELTFSDEAIREYCTSKIKVSRKYGPAFAKVFIQMIADLQAIECIDDFITREIQHISDNEVSISITDSYYLVIGSGHINKPVDHLGNTDWKKVSRVKLIRIEEICN